MARSTDKELVYSQLQEPTMVKTVPAVSRRHYHAILPYAQLMVTGTPGRLGPHVRILAALQFSIDSGHVFSRNQQPKGMNV
ncbi:hypothetical protein ACJMK2_015734 [Sinanodonta woodiana]|uniref:Uncharacterized protein n=1 Tax=Sinanodonta woodiana TaxID=1069815 RepID=A0ABD3USJ9_SINWO